MKMFFVTEMLRALDIFSIKKITNMANGINQRGEVRDDMCLEL